MAAHALRLLVLAALVLVMAAPAASAGTASVQDGLLTFVAAPGEANQITILRQGFPPYDYDVHEEGGGATGIETIAGGGCRLEGRLRPQAVCASVRRAVVRLGDGNDTGQMIPGASPIPIEFFGEAGDDALSTGAGDTTAPGSLLDGGEGDDRLAGGAELQRGGPGADSIAGVSVLEGGEGDDVLRKEGTGAGRLDAGPGNDSLFSDDGHPDVLICGTGVDTLSGIDQSDRPDPSCERPVINAPPPAPKVTVFELPKGRSRPGKDGRLAVWMRCSVPACAVTVQIRAAGEYRSPRFVRFRPREAPVRRLVVGDRATLVRLALSPAQRRGLRRTRAHEGIAAKVATRAPGRSSMFTDGLFCRRADPCDAAAPRSPRSLTIR